MQMPTPIAFPLLAAVPSHQARYVCFRSGHVGDADARGAAGYKISRPALGAALEEIQCEGQERHRVQGLSIFIYVSRLNISASSEPICTWFILALLLYIRKLVLKTVNINLIFISSPRYSIA